MQQQEEKLVFAMDVGFSWSLDPYYIAEQDHAFRNIPHDKT